MKKFYIPTSTLNFNNILSSESISPKAFYEKRGFGYHRWTTIPENPFKNVIVLYDKLCYFERPKSDSEDHPLLIEILLDEAQLKQKEDFFYCDHTIYLTPTTTNFLFFSDTDKTITLSMSEASSETKLLRLFKEKHLASVSKPKESYNPISIGDFCDLNEHEIEIDQRINKMKGLLYGYYIGAILSTDSGSVKHLNLLKEIHGIFAAILSSFNRKPTDYQDKRLDELFGVLNRDNSDYQKLLKTIGDESITDKVVNLDFVFPRGLEKKSSLLAQLQVQPEKNDEIHENPSIEWIKSKIVSDKNDMRHRAHLLSPYKSEVVVMEQKVSSLNTEFIVEDVEKKICLAWFNETLSAKETSGKISTYKEDLAKNITLKARDLYPDKDSWDRSPTREYLNDLRRHIAGEDFKHEWKNGLLSSIAAVIMAGDDWEKLLAYMQRKEMTDYRLAFAFYGELNGFANLTRDFTDLFYELEKEYVWEVYREFYGQLYGVSLAGLGTDLRIAEESKHVNIQSKIFNTEETQTNIDEEVSNQANEKCLNIIKEIKTNEKYDEKKYEKYCEQIKSHNMVKYNEIRELSTKKDGWKGLIDSLWKSNKPNSDDLFSNTTERASLPCFKKYPKESEFLLSLESLKNVQNNVFERIVENFEYTGRGKSKKEDHLNHFINLCNKEKKGETGRRTSLFNAFPSELSKSLKNDLSKQYLNYKEYEEQ